MAASQHYIRRRLLHMVEPGIYFGLRLFGRKSVTLLEAAFELRAFAFDKAIVARVIASVRIAGEEYVLNLVRARDKSNLRSCIHPSLHGAFGQRLLRFGEF